VTGFIGEVLIFESAA